MEGKLVNNFVAQSDSDCNDSEDQHLAVGCISGTMRSVSSRSSAAGVDVKPSDVTLVASASTSGPGRDNSAKRKTTFGGNGRTRKEKPTPSDNPKSAKKSNKFWNFLSKRKSSVEVDKCDHQDVGDECADDQSSTVSCLCSGLRRLQLQLRVADEEMGASDYTMDDDDNITSDVMTVCHSNGLPLDEASGLSDEFRADSIIESAQRRSLPADPSFASAAAVDDVTELLRSLTAQEDNVAALGHNRAIYPHLSYGSGGLNSPTSSTDANSSSHTWTITSNSAEGHPVHSSLKVSTAVNENLMLDGQGSEWKLNMGFIPRTIHTQVDYIHCLVPDLKKITNCSYYWGVMDRYEAERLLDNRPEGTFLLRDSAQEEFLFSVSFRRYSRSLHARVEQWNHKFSFDSHDQSVYASLSVCGLVEHYKDPACCMFFEPMLTLPLVRTFPFSLQHLCRAAICSLTTYDGISYLPLPKSLHQFLQYYHYKQRVRVRRFESLHS